MNLKPFAADPKKSLGRQFKEAPQNFEMTFKETVTALSIQVPSGDWNIRHKCLSIMKVICIGQDLLTH